MDERTLELLEFDAVRRLAAARAATALGRARAMALEPLPDRDGVHERQAILAEMMEAIGAGLRPSFGGLGDIRPLVRRAAVGGVLETEELAAILDALRSMAELDGWVARVGDRFPRLGGLRAGMGEFSGLVAAIGGCLDSRGRIIDSASRRLALLRGEIARLEEKIQETLRRLVRSSEVKRFLRYPNFTMVGHHFVLPVNKEHRGEIPGSVLRASASNETVYIEPAAIGEQSAQLSLLKAREQKELRRILRWLSALVGQVADSLLATIETAAELDLIHAKARYSLDYAMTAPVIEGEGALVLRGARHPLLEAYFRGDRAIAAEPSPDAGDPSGSPRVVTPIDLALGSAYRALVVTGPNTGGKTVALKTVGLLAVMAQSGLHVPAAEGSRFPVFDQVLLDVGDEQSLEQSLSTFSAHVRRITEILGLASERSLVLLDELGAGTDPADGAALGRAILDELDAIGCCSIVTTHIGDLKIHALSNPRAENAAVAFDDLTLRPLYRLVIGDVGASNALKIARHLKLPEQVAARAERYLSESKSGQLPEWELLVQARKEAEDARRRAHAAEVESLRVQEAFARRLVELEHEARKGDVLAQARARLEVGDKVVVPRLGYDRPGRLVRLDHRKRTAKVAIGHVTWDVAVDELVPQNPRVTGHDSANEPSRPRPTFTPLNETEE